MRRRWEGSQDHLLIRPVEVEQPPHSPHIIPDEYPFAGVLTREAFEDLTGLVERGMGGRPVGRRQMWFQYGCLTSARLVRDRTHRTHLETVLLTPTPPHAEKTTYYADGNMTQLGNHILLSAAYVTQWTITFH